MKIFKGQFALGCVDKQRLVGRFKKVRPARPQPFFRAERTLST
jgi:hypothetical protein